MGNIVLLDELTINKIAAGEVIERPASVVKELMENSIDAGATSVTAEIKNGGITYIRITDNGKGFLPDDMEIAFERHATSKIRSAKDLEEVKSMGFRGEALASIAAIARVELTSRTQDSEIGCRIVVEGGKVISKEETGCPKGTTIIVENLFYNTPVRYKFLKKDFTELGYVEDAVTRLALVNPHIAIKLQSLGKTLIQTNGNASIKDTVYSIYGKDIAENILNVDYKYEDMKVTGCIGKPEIAKANRTGQLFFVNGRYIKDKTLTSAAEQAFRGILPAGKYGFLILNLEIDSHQIDVNVHPAKLEIRFQEENKVFKLVYHSIKETLSKNKESEAAKENDEKEDILELIKEGSNAKFDLKELERQRDYIYSTPEENENQKEIPTPSTGNLIEDIYNDRLRQTITQDDILDSKEENKNGIDIDVKKEDDGVNYFEDALINDKLITIEDPGAEEKVSLKDDVQSETIKLESDVEKNKSSEYNVVKKDDEIKEDLNSSFEEMYRKTFGITPVEKVESKKDESEKLKLEIASDVNTTANVSFHNEVKYKYIGIVFEKYIIIEIDNELFIIDQRGANERIIYERLKKAYYSNGNKESQMMLLPDLIDLTSKQMDIARDNMLLLRKAGFEYEEFGENTIKLVGVPDMCIDLETKTLFVEILDEINKVARTSKEEIESKFIATIAANAAKNEKNAETFEEVDALMRDLLRLEKPFNDINGNSNAIKLTQAEIEKKISK